MTISIDGKTHKGEIHLRFSDGEFPRRYRSLDVENDQYGRCLVYVTHVGTPEWVDPLTVKVPLEYLITQIVKPSATYAKNRRLQKSGLKVVKG